MSTWADEIEEEEERTYQQAKAEASKREEPAATQARSKPKLDPFGNAKPREEVLAAREGKKEEEVIRQEAKEKYRPSLRLTRQQREQKEDLEQEIDNLKSKIHDQSSTQDQDIQRQVDEKEKELSELVKSFEAIAVESAHQPSAHSEADQPSSTPEASFRSQPRSRGPQSNDFGFRRGAQSSDVDCYNCGQRGHFARNCPQKMNEFGSFGGKKGGDKPCFNCGQLGHLARECPSGGGGRRGPPQSGSQCYACGDIGHFARECPNTA